MRHFVIFLLGVWAGSTFLALVQLFFQLFGYHDEDEWEDEKT